jgi:hypothetical protein
VSGKVAPVMVKPVPDKLTALTVTAAVPLDVKVTDCVEGVPTATLPKATVLELTVRPAVAKIPLPLNWMVADGVTSELLVITNDPVTEPALDGPNWTLRVVVLLAASVSGKVPTPSYENDALLADIFEITTVSELAFTREILLVAGLPTVTEPNATLLGVAVKLPALALAVPLAVLAGTIPPQPVRAMQPPRTINPNTRYES